VNRARKKYDIKTKTIGYERWHAKERRNMG
jgi:hypothetical protein